MSSTERLVVDSAFGSSRSATVLLAGHPDETHDDNGKGRPDARYFALGLQGDRAVVRHELPYPAVRSWYSSSGMAYCSSVRRGTIHTFSGGRWDEERFSDVPVDHILSVYVWPGERPEEDTVFLAARNDLHVRLDGVWTKHPLPGEGFPRQFAAERADRIFIGGSELYLWDGTGVSVLESPPGGSSSALVITPDDRLIAGSRYLNISKLDGSWERMDTPVAGFQGLVRLNDNIYALTDDDGVLKVSPGPMTIVTRPLEATSIVAVGDGLVAIGDDGVLVFDGKKWTELTLPAFSAGQKPV